jgi:hypothetical protein
MSTSPSQATRFHFPNLFKLNAAQCRSNKVALEQSSPHWATLTMTVGLKGLCLTWDFTGPGNTISYGMRGDSKSYCVLVTDTRIIYFPSTQTLFLSSASSGKARRAPGVWQLPSSEPGWRKDLNKSKMCSLRVYYEPETPHRTAVPTLHSLTL